MNRRGRAEVWLGDLLTIFAELRPGEAEAALIARMLRLETTTATRTVTPTEPGTETTPLTAPPPGEGRFPEAGAPSERAADQAAAASRLSPAARFVHVASGTGPAGAPPWEASTRVMEAPPKSRAEPPESAPILATRVRRAILAGAASTLAPEGAPDVRAILRTIGHGHPLLHLPRRQRPTLRRGAQLLIDEWLGMAPFAADARGVAVHLRRLISSDRLRVLRFLGSPLGRMRWPEGKPRPWSPPPRGTPVLVLSDFGLGGPLLDPARADLRQWLSFARMARDAGCPLVGLIPCEPARWPRELASRITLLHWSERLTAGLVRRALTHGMRPFA
jgi:hypothetical protein